MGQFSSKSKSLDRRLQPADEGWFDLEAEKTLPLISELRLPRAKGNRAVIDATEADSSQPISQKTRRLVWQAHDGVADRKSHHCFCCRTEVTSDEWHCGHIVARKCGGTRRVENLRVVCRRCIWDMAFMDMDEYIISRQLPVADELWGPFADFYQQVVSLTRYTLGTLDRLYRLGQLDARLYLELTKRVCSSRIELGQRVVLMRCIDQYRLRREAELREAKHTEAELGKYGDEMGKSKRG